MGHRREYSFHCLKSFTWHSHCRHLVLGADYDKLYCISLNSTAYLPTSYNISTAAKHLLNNASFQILYDLHEKNSHLLFTPSLVLLTTKITAQTYFHCL